MFATSALRTAFWGNHTGPLESFVRVITGNLDYSSVVGTPTLAEVSGQLDASGLVSVTTIALPELSKVGGAFRVANNGNLTTLSMPVLDAVGGTFEVSVNRELDAWTFSSLRTIGGSEFAPDMEILGNGDGLTCANDITPLYCALDAPRPDEVDLREFVSGNANDCPLTCGEDPG